MPEYYSSIGEAIGAAMQHNIRLAHSGRRPLDDPPLQVRRLPSAAADPYSVPGMIARLTEDASPDEVARIIEEVNGALVGVLPQLTELVAAAADWTRVRLVFPADPEVYFPTWETWKKLAAAHEMIQDVQKELATTVDGIAACPAQRADPQQYEMVRVLRTRELLDDVFGSGQDTSPPSVRAAGEKSRRLSAGPTPPPDPPSPELPLSRLSSDGSPMGNLADDHNTDVEIFSWADGLVWADCRTGLSEAAHQTLRDCGFTAPADPGNPASFTLPSELPRRDRNLAASTAARQLTHLGYMVVISPDLSVKTEDRQRAAARHASPAASKTRTGTSAASTAPPTPSAERPASRHPR
ncbi:hypothetical protein ACIQHY_12890 [Streptomyces sp. NPDC092359]|uniref:hypothetical protein n=1 Tax=Streptomyces sp. NPDC092359 TaxID=3366014 RepID=UPI0038208DE3